MPKYVSKNAVRRELCLYCNEYLRLDKCEQGGCDLLRVINKIPTVDLELNVVTPRPECKAPGEAE